MLCLFLIVLALPAALSTTVCTGSSLSLCVAGVCPTGYTCLNPATTAEVCCAQTTPSTCVDLINPKTGKSDCAGLKNLCNNSTYYALMTQQCPATCGRCTVTTTTTAATTTCADKVSPRTGVSDCASNAALCTNSAYYAFMTEQCPKTCGRCAATPAPSTCADLVNPNTGVSDCASTAHLCNNSAYYTFMTTQCPKTCGRCSTGK